MTGRRSWLDGRIDVLLAALADYGMDASRTSAAELIEERIRWVATNMRITPTTARRYLTDDALRDLAQTMVVSVADEAPGADIFAAPRTAALPIAILGRAIAALAEAIVLRLAERDDLDHVRTITAQLAQALSALGQLAADYHSAKDSVDGISGPVVMMPPSLLHRAARYLEAAAALARDAGVVPAEFDPAQAGQLADTFDKDAVTLRCYAQGT